MIVDAIEIDLVLAPQAADDLQSFIGLAAARLGVEVEGSPFGRERAADAKRGQQTPLGEDVDRSALLGHKHRVAERQRHDVHAEPHAPRAPCQGSHRGH